MQLASSELESMLSDIVGKPNVSDDPGILDGHVRPGAPRGVKPAFAVRPQTAEQVRMLVSMARQIKINLIPSSSLPPHFREDCLPEEEGVVLDLSAMDRIVRIDRRNKVALIEPGVTFSKLIPAVKEQGLKALTPLMPRRGKSVLSSYLEREPITIPKYHWDMTDPLLCTEIVFGTGDLFRTGSAAGPGSLEDQWAAGCAQKNPMGPAQTDFARIVQGAQGTMGIVTWATVKLEVEPTIHRLYFVRDTKLSRLIDFTYRALRPKLGDEFLILNQMEIATMISGEPDRIRDVASRQSPYTLVFCVSGYARFPEDRVRYQEKDLESIAQACGVTISREIPGCSAGRMKDVIGGLSPEPYFKLGPKGAFLDIFFITTLDRARGFVEVMEEVAGIFEYPVRDIGTYIQPIQHGRSCHLEFNLYYDPSDEADVEKAGSLFLDASRALSGAGAFFSRPYGIWSDIAYSRCPDTVSALRKVKNMLDPDGVLNRGKLCFRGVG